MSDNPVDKVLKNLDKALRDRPHQIQMDDLLKRPKAKQRLQDAIGSIPDPEEAINIVPEEYDPDYAADLAYDRYRDRVWDEREG